MDKWTNNLTVGIDDIDSQHRKLFDAVNNLFEAAKLGRDINEVEKMLSFLEGYVLDHFKTEEEYMSKYDYPDGARHGMKHKEFLKEFLKFKSEFSKNDAPVYMSFVIEGWLYKWMHEHFSTDDKLLGIYLKRKI